MPSTPPRRRLPQWLGPPGRGHRRRRGQRGGPGFEPALRPYFPDPSDRGFEAARRGEDELEAVQEPLDTLADVLRQVDIRRTGSLQS